MRIPCQLLHSSSTLLLFIQFYLFLLQTSQVTSFSLSDKPVSQLLSEKSAIIASLKTTASSYVDIHQAPYSNDVFFLRYCLNSDKDDIKSLEDQLIANLQWRTTSEEGSTICQAAQRALSKVTTTTTTTNSRWKNDDITAEAPYGSIILQYLTPQNIVTTTTPEGDLITCIRAGGIDDVQLMTAATVSQVVQFFLYAREVNSCVANDRSLTTNRLIAIITANSLEGVQLFWSGSKKDASADFRLALGTSSKLADGRYPNICGPTLLLNLPPLLNALVKLFTPLFPPAVKQRLRFASGTLLAGNRDLTQILANMPEREQFWKDLETILGRNTKE
jgi:hypothetical protein